MYSAQASHEPPHYEEAVATGRHGFGQTFTTQQPQQQQQCSAPPPPPPPPAAAAATPTPKMSSVTSTTTTKGVKKAFCLILASLNLVPYLLLLGTLIYILVRWETWNKDIWQVRYNLHDYEAFLITAVVVGVLTAIQIGEIITLSIENYCLLLTYFVFDILRIIFLAIVVPESKAINFAIVVVAMVLHVLTLILLVVFTVDVYRGRRTAANTVVLSTMSPPQTAAAAAAAPTPAAAYQPNQQQQQQPVLQPPMFYPPASSNPNYQLVMVPTGAGVVDAASAPPPNLATTLGGGGNGSSNTRVSPSARHPANGVQVFPTN